MGNVCCRLRDDDAPEKAGPVVDGAGGGGGGGGVEGDGGDSDGGYNSGAVDQEQMILCHIERRQKITSTPMEVEAGSFMRPSFPKSPEVTQFLLDAVGGTFVFDSMDEETMLQFVNAMQPQEYGEDEWVMRQGDVGDYFYVVEEGDVSFYISDDDGDGGGGEGEQQQPKAKMVGGGSRGCTFGELALLYNSPRAASVRANSPLKSYKIDQVTFRSLLMSNRAMDRLNLLSLVRKSPAFADLDESKMLKLADAFVVVEFGPGERIVNKGDHGDIMYIVKSGKVKAEDIGHGSSVYSDSYYEYGECFGERALITGETRAANISAVEPSSLLAISKDAVEGIIGPLELATRHSFLSHRLHSIPLFEHLPPGDVAHIVEHLKEESYVKGDKIPTTEAKLYLVEDGHALMRTRYDDKDGKKDTSLVKFSKGDYFVDLWGSGYSPIPQAAASLVAGANGVVANENMIDVEADMKCITFCMADMKRKRRSVIDAMHQSDVRHIKEIVPPTNRDVMNLSMLNKHRVVGSGAFGKVWLVTPKSSKSKPTFYALKMISKRHLVKVESVSSVLGEKNVLATINHPFLTHMESAFQDNDYLYFVMDYLQGGELFQLIYPDGKREYKPNPAWEESSLYKSFGNEYDSPFNRTKGVGVRKALFYSAGVIDAFEYLHARRIVYRDLKPENVMLNDRGYCVVVDMGFAKVVLDKTYTTCGTPEYLSPEAILYKGHNHVADYWSYACFLYELIVGHTPFFKSGIAQLRLLQSITKARYTFPAKLVKPQNSDNGLDQALYHWKDLVSRLLKKEPVERLGNLRNGIDDILDHGWFAKIDFDEFRDQDMPAPWVPPVSADPLDDTRDGKVAKKEDKPEVFYEMLSAKDQAMFKGF